MVSKYRPADIPDPSSEKRPIEVENLETSTGCRRIEDTELVGNVARREVFEDIDLAERRQSGVAREAIRPNVRATNIVISVKKGKMGSYGNVWSD